MYKKVSALLGACFAVLWSSYSSAITVSPQAVLSLAPSAIDVNMGDVVSIDLLLDATPFSGTTMSEIYTGQVRVGYDPAKVDFLGFTEAVSGTTMTLSSGADNFVIQFGDLTFPTANTGRIGTYSFKVRNMAGSAMIDVADANPSGSFGIQSPFAPFTPQVAGTTLNIQPSAVPVPAAAWLMFSGLGLLGVAGRRSS